MNQGEHWQSDRGYGEHPHGGRGSAHEFESWRRIPPRERWSRDEERGSRYDDPRREEHPFESQRGERGDWRGGDSFASPPRGFDDSQYGYVRRGGNGMGAHWGAARPSFEDHGFGGTGGPASATRDSYGGSERAP